MPAVRIRGPGLSGRGGEPGVRYKVTSTEATEMTATSDRVYDAVLAGRVRRADGSVENRGHWNAKDKHAI